MKFTNKALLKALGTTAASTGVGAGVGALVDKEDRARGARRGAVAGAATGLASTAPGFIQAHRYTKKLPKGVSLSDVKGFDAKNYADKLISSGVSVQDASKDALRQAKALDSALSAGKLQKSDLLLLPGAGVAGGIEAYRGVKKDKKASLESSVFKNIAKKSLLGGAIGAGVGAGMGSLVARKDERKGTALKGAVIGGLATGTLGGVLNVRTANKLLRNIKEYKKSLKTSVELQRKAARIEDSARKATGFFTKEVQDLSPIVQKTIETREQLHFLDNKLRDALSRTHKNLDKITKIDPYLDVAAPILMAPSIGLVSRGTPKKKEKTAMTPKTKALMTILSMPAVGAITGGLAGNLQARGLKTDEETARSMKLKGTLTGALLGAGVGAGAAIPQAGRYQAFSRIKKAVPKLKGEKKNLQRALKEIQSELGGKSPDPLQKIELQGIQDALATRSKGLSMAREVPESNIINKEYLKYQVAPIGLPAAALTGLLGGRIASASEYGKHQRKQLAEKKQRKQEKAMKQKTSSNPIDEYLMVKEAARPGVGLLQRGKDLASGAGNWKGVAGLIAAGVAANAAEGLLSDVYNAARGAATKAIGFRNMMKENPELAKEDRKKVQQIFGTLHKFNPDMATDPYTAGSFVKKINEFDYIDSKTIGELVSARSKTQKDQIFGGQLAPMVTGAIGEQKRLGAAREKEEMKSGLAISPEYQARKMFAELSGRESAEKRMSAMGKQSSLEKYLISR